MQGQRSIINSAPEALEFERGSTSSNTNVERQGIWTEMLNHPFENRLLLSPGDGNVTFPHAGSQEGRSLSGWNSAEPGFSQNPGSPLMPGEAKTEHSWLSSLTADEGAEPRLGERDYQPTNTLSLGSVNMNHSMNQVANGPSFLQNAGSVNIPQNVNLSLGYAGTHENQNVEAGISTMQYKSGGPGSEHIASDGSSVDCRRVSCKRKALEGISAQSSIGASSSNSQRAESSVQNRIPARNNTSDSLTLSAPRENQSGVDPHELLDPRLGAGNRRQTSDSHHVEGNVESSHRNFRMRTNPSYQQDPVQFNLSLSGNSVRGSSIWPSHQVPSGFTQFNQSLDAGPRAFNASTPQIHPNSNGLLQNAQLNPWDGTSDSSVGSSSSSLVSARERPSMLEEDNSEHTPINGPAPPVNVRATRRQLADPRSWGLANGSASRVGSSTIVASQSPAPARVYRPIPPSQSRQVIHASAAASGSEPGGQSHNFTLQRVSPASSQQMAFSSGAGPQGSPQPPRHPFWLDRPGNVPNGVLPSVRTFAAAREGRIRMITEIRNVLDSLRRNNGHFVYEDLIALDPLILNGMALLQDRHRDMRLDVDNMSYEDLLALEDQIGNVKTGLTEETVVKFLKQRKFSSERMGAPEDNEPCCICQEMYAEDEQLGVLDCGHNLHTACLTKWLTEKNMCPICKTTALVTGDQAS